MTTDAVGTKFTSTIDCCLREDVTPSVSYSHALQLMQRSSWFKLVQPGDAQLATSLLHVPTTRPLATNFQDSVSSIGVLSRHHLDSCQRAGPPSGGFADRHGGRRRMH